MSFPMKTGQVGDAVSVHQKALILSLLSVYIEETCKTALLYAIHHGHSEVTPEDMLKSLKYQMISEHGCGQELKMNLKEAMETETLTELEQKQHGCNAVLNHLPNAMNAISQNPTARGQTQAVISSIIGCKEDEENDDDGDEEKENIGEEEEENEEDEDEEEDEEDEDDDTEDKNGHDDNSDKSMECDCEMCSEMDQLYDIKVEPRDDLEKMIMSHFQTVYDKYQK